MAYFILALILLTLPGLILLPVLGIKKHRFLLLVPLSYAYYVVIASVTKLQNLPLSQAYVLYIGSLITLGIIGFMANKYRNNLTRWHLVPVNGYWFVGICVVAVSYALYRLWAGPYIEMPADLFRHLEYAQYQYGRIQTGFLGYPVELKHLFSQSPGVWYSFYGLVSYLASMSLEQSLAPAMLLNGLVFLCLSYAFAWFIFGQMSFSQHERLAASLLSTFFLFSHMGINVFAYIRYYTLAPTMLNFGFYYGAIVLIYRLINASSNRFRDGLLLLVFSGCAAIVHNQEALYIAIMGGLILAWHVILKPFVNKTLYRARSTVSHWWREVSKIQLALLILLTLGFLAAVATTYLHLTRPSDLANKVLQLSEQGPILNRILYLNPEYQFVRVITLWGGFVYLLFVIFYKRLIVHPYLFMGMLLPLFTVFNPVFVDWFLRLDGPHTLWRVLYILPLNLVAATCVLFCYSTLLDGKVFLKLNVVVALFLMIALLFPFNVGRFNNPYSRLTLKPVQLENAYTHWADLLEFLGDETEKKVVLTDPVTAYVISGLTSHHTYNYKFMATSAYANHRYNFDDYSDQPLKRFKGSLLVINERDGAYSNTGRDAQHWPAEIMKVSAYYSSALKPHLEANPDRFVKVWEADKINVYSIEN